VTILSSPPAQIACPGWCAGHLPTDDDVVHISREQVIEVLADGEAETLYVSIEQVGTGSVSPAAVRLAEGAYSTPMSLAQAWRLATALQSAVFEAVSDGAR